MSLIFSPTRTRREPYGARRSRGIAAVEFVIAVPVLLLLALAVGELGRAFVHYDSLSHSVRNSVRFLSENAIEGTTGVVNISDSVRQQTTNLARFGNAAGTEPAMYRQFRTMAVEVIDAGNNNVEVRATYDYEPLIGLILPTSVPMRIVVTMRAIS
jgi:Flp pilus assembly protein TadG